MSSFSNPHFMYLFALKGEKGAQGKRKLAYGQSPEDALEILSYRMTQQEMDEIIRDDYIKIHQRQLQEYAHMLA